MVEGLQPARRPSAAIVLATSAGGVGRHVHSLAAGLGRAGIAATVCGPAATNAQFGFTDVGAGFVAVEISAGADPLADARAALRLRAPTGRADVVHAHGLRAGLVAGLAAPRHLPLVVTWHNRLLAGGRLARAAERYVARRADVTLGASADLVARARALGAADARLAPVAAPPTPSPARSRADVRAELGAGERPVVLAVGRLAPQKDYPTLLAAARGWARRDVPPLVAIAGDGPGRPDLQRRIDVEQLPVILLGHRTDAADLLAGADVFVSTSVWEARSLVVQEAVRAGCPVVATAVGGMPELVGDGGAVLVPPGDAAAVERAVAELLDDPRRRAALAARARELSATWPDEQGTVDQVIAVYRELTAR